jgi:hypothetical protein
MGFPNQMIIALLWQFPANYAPDHGERQRAVNLALKRKIAERYSASARELNLSQSDGVECPTCLVWHDLICMSVFTGRQRHAGITSFDRMAKGSYAVRILRSASERGAKNFQRC